MQPSQPSEPLSSEPLLATRSIVPDRGESRGVIRQLIDHFEPTTGLAVRVGLRVAAIIAFSLYILSGDQSPESVLNKLPAWVHWSLLVFIGWYGWWETSLFMKKSSQPHARSGSAGVYRRTKAERGQRITLLVQTPGHLRTLLEGVEAYECRFEIKVAEGVREFLAGPEVSAEFLARLKESAAPDPWKDGFAIFHNADNVIIGLCGFAGPPGADGTVEIAYGIAPGYQNRGYAGETAQELVAFALASGRVRTVCAHTLPENNASTRVLKKCGFTRTGEVTHPDDGLVWRWEMQPKMA